MQINYAILPNSVVVSFEDKVHSYGVNTPTYEKIIEAIRENRLEDIVDLCDSSLLFKDCGDSRLQFRNGVVYYENAPLPDELSRQILYFHEHKLPFDRLALFAANLMTNVSFNVRQQLFTFLSHNGHPFTETGNFIAYKAVSRDLKDLRTSTIDNSPGRIVSMPRSQVDDNPNNTCSTGLHVCSFSYLNQMYSGATIILVEVDPQDVVSVPTDYEGTKMRVCKYKVLSVFRAAAPLDDGIFDEEDYDFGTEEVESSSEASDYTW